MCLDITCNHAEFNSWTFLPWLSEQPVVSLCFDHMWLLTMCTLCPVSQVLHVRAFFCSGCEATIEGTCLSKPVMNCKFSFILVLKTALVDTAGLILEDHVMYFAFCWKDVILLIRLGTNFYCRFVVRAGVAGNEQELWESATFHSKPHGHCVYLNRNDNFFSQLHHLRNGSLPWNHALS